MIDETPQPGETPHHEGDPWSFADPDTSWWRGEIDRPTTDPPGGPGPRPRRRPAQHQVASGGVSGGTGTLLPPAETERPRTAAAARAHAAAARDVAEELDARPEPAVLERDHDQPDPHRYDPLRPPGGHIARHTAATVAADQPVAEAKSAATDQASAETKSDATATAMFPAADQPTTGAKFPAADQPIAGAKPAAAGRSTAAARSQPAGQPVAGPKFVAADQTVAGAKFVASDQSNGGSRLIQVPLVPVESPEPPPVAAPEPDVMVLPEPNSRNRPTVPLERGPAGVTRQLRHGYPTEPLPPATGSARTPTPVSNGWRTRRSGAPTRRAPPQPLPVDRPAHAAVRTRGRRPTRRPVPAMLALVALALVSAFFAWVSAEPFWLAAGHGENGYATTTHCTGAGVTQRCAGRFAAADGGFTVGPGDPARGRSGRAGAGHGGAGPDGQPGQPPDLPRRHQPAAAAALDRWASRWCCSAATRIAGVTGARRLETGRARRGAVLASLAGPLLLLAGFLIAAY